MTFNRRMETAGYDVRHYCSLIQCTTPRVEDLPSLHLEGRAGDGWKLNRALRQIADTIPYRVITVNLKTLMQQLHQQISGKISEHRNAESDQEHINAAPEKSPAGEDTARSADSKVG
jgi:hypothetical protein